MKQTSSAILKTSVIAFPYPFVVDDNPLDSATVLVAHPICVVNAELECEIFITAYIHNYLNTKCIVVPGLIEPYVRLVGSKKRLNQLNMIV